MGVVYVMVTVVKIGCEMNCLTDGCSLEFLCRQHHCMSLCVKI